jgi:hypothetical protein
MEEVGVAKKYVKSWITDHGDGRLMVAVKNKSEEEAKQLVREKVIAEPPDQPQPRRSNNPKQDAEPYHIQLSSISLIYDTFRRGFSAIPEIAYTDNQMSESEYIFELQNVSVEKRNIAMEAQAEKEHRVNRSRTVAAAASKPKCQMTGCTTKVHPICKQKKFCYRHAEKQKCLKCNKNLPQRFGGLCKACFDKEGKKKLCKGCGWKIEETRIKILILVLPCVKLIGVFV